MTRFLRLFGVVIATLALLTAVPAPASAAGTLDHQSPTSGQGALAAASTVHGCPFEDFCIYSGTNFSGTKKEFFRCAQFDFVPFVGHGSWVNNQTTGTKAAFYNQNKTFLNFTAGAFATNSNKDWTNVFYVVPC